MKEIAKRLKDVREKIGKTQVEMAKEFHFSKQIYNNIEQAKRRLQIEEIVILKHRFNIDSNWLIFGEGSMNVEENTNKNELINLILDYRTYGGEVNMVKNEIIKKILDRFYKQTKNLFHLKSKSHKFGNRVHYIFIKILKSYQYDSSIEDSKNSLRNKIEEFDDKSAYLKEVKKELYLLLENINNKDCYYILQNPSIVIEQIKSKISPINIKIFFNGLS